MHATLPEHGLRGVYTLQGLLDLLDSEQPSQDMVDWVAKHFEIVTTTENLKSDIEKALPTEYLDIDPDDFQWKVAGEAGFGIMSTGLIFAKTCTRSGLHMFDYIEYPSLIRGGHNTYQVTARKDRVYAQRTHVHVLLALNEAAIIKHKEELAPGAVVLYDEENVSIEPYEGINFYNIPFSKIIEAEGLSKVMKNNIGLGASIAVLGMGISTLYGLIEEMFHRKGPEVIQMNQKAARAGYNHIMQNYRVVKHKPQVHSKDNIVVTGNDAISLGAIAAGCQIYVAYPMTPASAILHYLAATQKEHGMVIKHAEDEISVVNMVVGAGSVGARAMCGTSGGGFCLMTEGYGLAAMTETPCVLVNAMRGAPATGLPTWTEQADLRMALHASHGDFPRVVFAVSDVDDCFDLTVEAFNVAETLQTPVIILTDKYLAESKSSTAPFPTEVPIDRGEFSKENIGRYNLTPTGVSKRVLPGTKGVTVRSNSDEHDEMGHSSEDIDNRKIMMKKRMDKLKQMDVPAPYVYGPDDAPLTVVTWGSTKGPMLEAIRLLKKEGVEIRYTNLTHIAPFPKDFKAIIKDRKTMIIEGNQSGQMEGYIKEMTGMSFDHTYRKYDGRPFYPEELAAKIKEALR
ncbi:2-oxoacid:acceptor oxidoreductase subunit alpha [Candidatus Woesearchaeota archaeon]|nr:2-oxoacid:acceptor oxidoreductase subunit alpha [Candidatus Woesearchaeota archaeon]